MAKQLTGDMNSPYLGCFPAHRRGLGRNADGRVSELSKNFLNRQFIIAVYVLIKQDARVEKYTYHQSYIFLLIYSLIFGNKISSPRLFHQ
jgi:hypothetical protein